MPRRPRGWKVWTAPSGKNYRCRWRGRYGSGQETFVREKDALDLERKKIENFQRMDAGLELLPEPTPFRTIGSFADEYLEYSKKEKKPKTHKNFDTPAVASIRSFFGEHHGLSAVKRADFQRWKHSLKQGSPTQKTTAGMMVQAGAAFFNYARRMEYITQSPAFGAKKPKGGAGGRELTDAELKDLLGAAPEALYRTGTFSLNTYLRIEETCQFDWRYVFEIPGHGWFGRIPKETRKNAESATKDCVFPINAAARAVMGERRASGRVFQWSAWTVQHQLVAVRRSKKMPEDITFHCLRHTGATRYLATDGHMEDLLEESGSGLWKDPRSLLKYVHVRPETLAPRFAAVKFPVVAPTWAPK